MKKNLVEQYKLFEDLPVGVMLLNSQFEVFFWNNILASWTQKSFEEVAEKKIFEIYPDFYEGSLFKKNRLEAALSSGVPLVLSSQLHKHFITIPSLYEGLSRRQDTTVVPIKHPESDEQCLMVVINDVTDMFYNLSETRRIKEELEEKQEELTNKNDDLIYRTGVIENQKLEISNANKKLRSAQIDLEEKAAQLQRSSQYKSEFLANMSHELRTPLNSIIILSQDLAKNKDGNLDESQVESAMVVNNSGKDLLILINDILDLTKIESGKMIITVDEINIVEMLKDLELNFKFIISNKQLSYSVDIDDDLPAVMFSDQMKVQQILKNFITNAIKFTHEGGIQIKARVPREEDNASDLGCSDNNAVVFSITDTGIGIDQNHIQEVFEAFSQADGSISRSYGGTGLGLSISSQLTKLLGGEIRLKSELGKGSDFSIIIPIKIDPNEKVKVNSSVSVINTGIDLKKAGKKVDLITSEVPIDEERFKGKKILVVDDDMRNVFALGKILTEAGFQVFKAGNGQKGLDVLEENNDIDVVLLDLVMPVMDGFTTLERIKSDERFEKIKVLVITATIRKVDETRCKELGANGFMHKPLNIEAVFREIGIMIE